MISHYVHNGRPIDWTESRRRCTEMIAKDREHGHKTSLKQGDWVRMPDGREGRLVHKEFLYHNASLKRDIWFLEVSSGDQIISFTNPKELRVVPEPVRVRSVVGADYW